MARNNLLHIKSFELFYSLINFLFSRPDQMEPSNNTINITDSGYIHGLFNRINNTCMTATCYNNKALRGIKKNALVIKNFITFDFPILFDCEYIQRLPDMFPWNLPSGPNPFCQLNRRSVKFDSINKNSRVWRC